MAVSFGPVPAMGSGDVLSSEDDIVDDDESDDDELGSPEPPSAFERGVR